MEESSEFQEHSEQLLVVSGHRENHHKNRQIIDNKNNNSYIHYQVPIQVNIGEGHSQGEVVGGAEDQSRVDRLLDDP